MELMCQSQSIYQKLILDFTQNNQLSHTKVANYTSSQGLIDEKVLSAMKNKKLSIFFRNMPRGTKCNFISPDQDLSKQPIFIKAYKEHNNFEKIQNLAKSIDAKAKCHPNMIHSGVKAQIERISTCNNVIGDLKSLKKTICLHHSIDASNCDNDKVNSLSKAIKRHSKEGKSNCSKNLVNKISQASKCWISPSQKYHIRRCLFPKDRHFIKLCGGLDKGDFYFIQIYIKN